MMFDYETFLSPFTWRYGSARAMRRHVERGAPPPPAAPRLGGPGPRPDPRPAWSPRSRWPTWRRTRTKSTSSAPASGRRRLRHDLVAELRTFAEQCPGRRADPAPGGHQSGHSRQCRCAAPAGGVGADRRALRELLAALAGRIEETAELVCMGYTHLQPAEPTTVGYRLAQLRAGPAGRPGRRWRACGRPCAARVSRGRWGRRLRRATAGGERAHASRGRGAGDGIMLGLEAFPVATQVAPRRQDWEVLTVLAGIAQSVYRFAFDLRLLQSPPIGEWSEPFGRAQVGSSAMPFKRNPINAENLCSLARSWRRCRRVAWATPPSRCWNARSTTRPTAA
jgi:adenylosuccinate lyase